MATKIWAKWEFSLTTVWFKWDPPVCGLAINIASFLHLLKRVDFEAIVDHSDLTHIIKSKTEPATTRIKRLLELISSYSFNLYYMKGKDMILSNFCLDRCMIPATHMKSFQYYLICIILYIRLITE